MVGFLKEGCEGSKEALQGQSGVAFSVGQLPTHVGQATGNNRLNPAPWKA